MQSNGNKTCNCWPLGQVPATCVGEQKTSIHHEIVVKKYKHAHAHDLDSQSAFAYSVKELDSLFVFLSNNVPCLSHDLCIEAMHLP